MSEARPRIPYGDGSLAWSDGGFRFEIPRPPATRGAIDLPEARASLDRPVGSEAIEDRVRGAREVVFVVSDGTRATAIHRLLPDLVERVERGGARVAFAMASGLHRLPSNEEVGRILGSVGAGREVLLHDPDADEGLVPVGVTAGGTPVAVHRRVVEADAVVLTGAVGFHYYAGFSGGRKALVPGLAARRTIEGNHLRALRSDGSRHPLARVARLAGNPVHRDMVEGAAMVAPAFLVNTVVTADRELEAVFAGHWRAAHLAACRYLVRTRTVSVPPRPIVVVSAGGAPHDIDLIQSHKAFEAAMPALRDGGVLVLVASCRDGGGHPDFLPCFELESEAAHVASLRERFRVYAQTALAWRRKASRCTLVLVSSLAPDLVRSLGAVPAEDLDSALDVARRYAPAGSKGWLFPEGVRWCVRRSDCADGVTVGPAGARHD